MSTIEDLDFPKAVLTRIIKASLPENFAIQKEARQAVTKAATVFVSYLAATANDCAREAGHKTVMPNDVFLALEAVGLSDFIEKLKVDLDAHTTIIKERKKNKLSAGASSKGEAAEDNDDVEVAEEEDEAEEGNEERENAVKAQEEASESSSEKPKEIIDAPTAQQNTDSQPTDTNASDAAPAPAPSPASIPKESTEAMDVDDDQGDRLKRPRIE